jgi:hypothetical protein
LKFFGFQAIASSVEKLPAKALAGEHPFDQLLAGLLLVDKRGAQRALSLNVVLSGPEADAAWLGAGAGRRRQAERRIKQLDIVRTLGPPQLNKILVYLEDRVPSDISDLWGELKKFSFPP